MSQKKQSGHDSNKNLEDINKALAQESTLLDLIEEKSIERLAEKLLQDPSDCLKKTELERSILSLRNQRIRDIINQLSPPNTETNLPQRIGSYWNLARELIPATLIVSSLLWLFGLYSAYKADIREDRSAQDINDQRIIEDYFNSIKDIRIGQEYQQSEQEESEFIHNLTLITLRELSDASSRKASIALLLNKLQIPETFKPQDDPSQPSNEQEEEPSHPTESKQETNSGTSIQDEETFYKGGDLKFTDFTGYEFNQANFSKADLRGAVFENAQLKSAIFSFADLSCDALEKDGNWGWLPLIGESLSKQLDYQCADLSHANLTGANLTGANLQGVTSAKDDPKECKAKSDRKCHVVLTNTNFTNADLTGADLTGADLTGAILKNADLTDAIFDQAILLQTDLREAKITDAQLSGDQGPYWCNVALSASPESDRKLDSDRDCDRLIKVLSDRYGATHAEEVFNAAKAKTWD